MTISAVELHLLAESMGVQLQRHTGGCPGWYDHHRRIISTRRGQSIGQYKSVLAHELGHAHYNDPPGHHGAHELRADRFAARLFISPVEYATAETIYGPHPATLANELGVTVKVLKTWQTLYERTAA